jgi:long-chain acyl-CoA synthetase
MKIAADGELLVRGPHVFKGYYKNEAVTRETIDDEGWLHSGDVAELDDEGFLRITDRKKELIITAGGKNISPEKVENALKTSPYINEVVAVGDARNFISALVQIEYDVVADWATRQQIQYTSFADLAAKPEVVKLLDREILRCNELLPRVAQVRAFRTLPKELSEDDGELTATRKVRRRNVLASYQSLVAEIYG